MSKRRIVAGRAIAAEYMLDRMSRLGFLGRLLLVLTCSCSFIDVRGPASHPPEHGELQCTRDYVLPVMDTVFATGELGLTGAMLYLGATDHTSDAGAIVAIAAIPVLILGTATAFSARHGYDAVSRCRRAVAAAGGVPST
jgi:hypothetical protein